MKYVTQAFLLIVISCVLGVAAPARAGEHVYTLAVVPQYASTQAFREWKPLLSRLEQLTGYRFKLLAYDDFSLFEKDFGEGIPDLIYLNPYHLIVAKQQQNYLPLVRDNAPLSGILVALKSGKIKTLEDLNGKTIAFPSPNSLGASLYMRALLSEKMHIKFTPVYVGSHQNVYRQVLLGDAAAGGGVQKTFKKEPESLQTELKVLFTAPDIASHPLAVHPRVTAEARKKIVAAIFAIRDDPEANKLLAAVQLPQPVEADFDRDYAELAKFRLDRYYIKQAK
jgi:phosphonate transport system substrate-binding protein